jgi:hypothetical protein
LAGNAAEILSVQAAVYYDDSFGAGHALLQREFACPAMPKGLSMSQRTALVTGASRGIGRACAISLSAAGHHVVLAARQMDKLETVAGEIREKGGQATVISLDLGSADNIRESMKALLAQVGRIDILVNNAGITKDMLAMRMKQEDWEEVLRVNLTGSFLVRGGPDGQCRPSQLRSLKGGHDRPHQDPRPGTCRPQHHRQCRRAGLHRNRHDRCLE